MLAAVSPASDPRGGLDNYFLGGQKRAAPTDVPRQLAPSARLAAAKPTDQPSGPPARIPTSSQRPWAGTNQRIPYARHAFVPPDYANDAIRSSEICTGDVVFVQKDGAAAPAMGTNRCSVSVGIPALNRLLHDERGTRAGFGAGWETGADAGPVSDAVRRKVLAARQAVLDAARADLKEAEQFEAMWTPSADEASQREKRERINLKEARRQDVEEAEASVEAAKRRLNLEDLDMTVDWRAVDLLTRFDPDGVVISVDDDLASKHGVLVNVCVNGPTPCRNTKTALYADGLERHSMSHSDRMAHASRRAAPQTIDDGCVIMDRVYVGLFVHTQRNAAGDGVERHFCYRLFSGRHLQELGARGDPPLDDDARAPTNVPGGFQTGPMRREMLRDLCTAWRVGTVMDTRRVGDLGDGTQHVLLNVVIEPCTVPQLRKFFNAPGIGGRAQWDRNLLDNRNDLLKNYNEVTRKAIIKAQIEQLEAALTEATLTDEKEEAERAEARDNFARQLRAYAKLLEKVPEVEVVKVQELKGVADGLKKSKSSEPLGKEFFEKVKRSLISTRQAIRKKLGFY